MFINRFLFFGPFFVSCLAFEHTYKPVLKKLENFKAIEGNFTFNQGYVGNPGGKYGVFNFPDSLKPPLLRHEGQKAFKFFNATKISVSMYEKDAVILLMNTPPSGKYFSMVNYVMARFQHNQTNILPWAPTVQINDPINQLSINTSDDKAYNATVLFISTADDDTYHEIKNAFIDSGFHPKSINLLPILKEKVKLRTHRIWYLDESDLISWHFRLGEYNHLDSEIIKYLNTTFKFYYLSYEGFEKSNPIVETTLRNRTTGKTQNSMQNDFDELILKVTRDMPFQIITLNHVVPDLNQCLMNKSSYEVFFPIPELNFTGAPGSCDFFVRDCLYSMYPNVHDPVNLEAMRFTKNRTYTLVGINQVEMNTTIYSNLLITVLKNPENVNHTLNLTSTDLKGSASRYGEKYSNFFVYQWTRTCLEKEYCTEVTYNQINPDTDYVIFAERKYLNPMTKIGPDPNELIPMKIIIQ